MSKKFSASLVAVIVVGLGIGVAAGAVQARLGGVAANRTAAGSVAQQATAVASSSPQNQSSQPSEAGGRRSNFGTVEDATPTGFTLASANSRTQVVTSKDTKVTKMSDAKPADLKVGESITVRGNQQAEGSLVALSIQVGTSEDMRGMLAGMMGSAVQGGFRGQSPGSGSAMPQQGTLPSRTQGQGGLQGMGGSTVNGTIDSISGSTIMVKTPTGNPTGVTVSDATTVVKMMEGSLSDIQSGQAAVVSGENNSDGTLVASSVQLLPAGLIQGGR